MNRTGKIRRTKKDRRYFTLEDEEREENRKEKRRSSTDKGRRDGYEREKL